MIKHVKEMFDDHLMNRNINLMYFISSLMWARFYIPIIALFYIASQVPLEQFAIIMSVFALATLVLEIPSGVVADILGKKNTMIIAAILYAIELVMISFMNGFWPFLIAKIISGFGVGLMSGTKESIVYDSLKKLNKTKEHKKISGKITMYTNISTAFIYVIGGILFSIDSKLPAMISIPFVFIGIILMLFLKEPYRNDKKLTFRNSVNHLKESWYFFKNNKDIQFLGFFAFMSFAAISISLSVSSAYFELVLIPIALMGAVAFVGSMATAYTAKKADSIEKFLGIRRSFYLIQLITTLGLFLMALLIPYVGILFYLLIPIISGFSQVTLNHYINIKVESSHRTTMLSINNFFGNLGIFILFPVFGFITKGSGMNAAFWILGGLFLTYNIIMIFTTNTLRPKKTRYVE